ncbi:hypothetical protein MSG28_011211 [Choristoneura fumiferana]|uniref:Uncharacterized protein n=1 Tax=Choristoneura fumiferana TaxID=7141 RepID=A0ACC0KRR1_CHOFU|nr:hypothetical protein MSG28_011211 [Choristoneura fumiferana]
MVKSLNGDPEWILGGAADHRSARWTTFYGTENLNWVHNAWWIWKSNKPSCSIHRLMTKTATRQPTSTASTFGVHSLSTGGPLVDAALTTSSRVVHEFLSSHYGGEQRAVTEWSTHRPCMATSRFRIMDGLGSYRLPFLEEDLFLYPTSCTEIFPTWKSNNDFLLLTTDFYYEKERHKITLLVKMYGMSTTLVAQKFHPGRTRCVRESFALEMLIVGTAVRAQRGVATDQHLCPLGDP